MRDWLVLALFTLCVCVLFSSIVLFVWAIAAGGSLLLFGLAGGLELFGLALASIGERLARKVVRFPWLR